MSSGLYSHTTRGTGTVLTATIYNGDHQNHITNLNPEMSGAYSDSVSEMQDTFDPGGVGTENLPGNLAEELAALRFVIQQIHGGAQWYDVPASSGPAGDVNGPAGGVVEAEYTQFDGTTGKLIQGSGKTNAAASDVRSAASNKIMTTDLIETAAAAVALTDAANVALDWDTGVNFTLTIGGNRTLSNPTNGQPGTSRSIRITQDGTGSRTLAYGGQYKFPGGTEPVLSTAAGAIDRLLIFCHSSTEFEVYVMGKDLKV